MLALTLAAVGIYGVFSYFVGERTHEIAVRLALGATPAAVRRLVVGRGLTLTAGGLAIGLVGAVADERDRRAACSTRCARSNPAPFVTRDVVRRRRGGGGLLAAGPPRVARRSAGGPQTGLIRRDRIRGCLLLLPGSAPCSVAPASS